MVTISYLDYTYKLHCTILVVSNSSCIRATDHVLQFLSIRLWFWAQASQTVPSWYSVESCSRSRIWRMYWWNWWYGFFPALSIQSQSRRSSTCTNETSQPEENDSEHYFSRLQLSNVLSWYKCATTSQLWIIFYSAFAKHGQASQHADDASFCDESVFLSGACILRFTMTTSGWNNYNALKGILITWIFSLITLQKLMATIHSRHMDRPSDSDTTQNRTIVHDGIIRRHGFYGFISLIVSILCQLPSMKPTANPISCHGL